MIFQKKVENGKQQRIEGTIRKQYKTTFGYLLKTAPENLLHVVILFLSKNQNLPRPQSCP